MTRFSPRTARNLTLVGATASALALSSCGLSDEYQDDRGKGDAPVSVAVSRGVLVIESSDGYPNTQYQALPGNIVVIQTDRDYQAPVTVCSPELAASVIYTIESQAPDRQDGDLALQVPRLEVAPKEWLELNGPSFGLTSTCEPASLTTSPSVGLE